MRYCDDCRGLFMADSLLDGKCSKCWAWIEEFEARQAYLKEFGR